MAQRLKKKICLQCRRPVFNPRMRKIPWRRTWQPTPVFLPRKSHGQRGLGAAVHEVAENQTWLKWWSNSSITPFSASSAKLHDILVHRVPAGAAHTNLISVSMTWFFSSGSSWNGLFSSAVIMRPRVACTDVHYLQDSPWIFSSWHLLSFHSSEKSLLYHHVNVLPLLSVFALWNSSSQTPYLLK